MLQPFSLQYASPKPCSCKCYLKGAMLGFLYVVASTPCPVHHIANVSSVAIKTAHGSHCSPREHGVLLTASPGLTYTCPSPRGRISWITGWLPPVRKVLWFTMSPPFIRHLYSLIHTPPPMPGSSTTPKAAQAPLHIIPYW